MGIRDSWHRRRTAKAIDRFWEWWQGGGRSTAAHVATAGGDSSEVLTRHVAALSRGLRWDISPGADGGLAFTLSSAGDPAARVVAERWRRVAPPDSGWDFRTSKIAEPAALEASIQIAGATIDLTRLTFHLSDADRGPRLDVTVAHPAFRDLPGDVPHQIAFLALDWALGEDAVERWVGAIDVSPLPGDDDVIALRNAIDARAATRQPDSWAALEADIDGRPLVALVNTGVDRFDAPTHDLHHAVSVRYPADERGLPVDVVTLQQAEDGLEDIPGAILVATVTHDGVRTLHLYTDSDDEPATRTISAIARQIGRRLDVTPDPGWTAVRPLQP
jgi:hypothetical protein